MENPELIEIIDQLKEVNRNLGLLRIQFNEYRKEFKSDIQHLTKMSS